MKKILFTLQFVLAGLILIPFTSGAQCTCDQTRLKNIMDNATVTLRDYSTGAVVSTLSPGTTYRVRVSSTAYSCQTVGSGCAGINAPVTFIIKSLDGATSFSGNPVPPFIGTDVGSPNYQGDILITTLTGDDFTDQVYFRVGTQCFPSPTCGLLTSNNAADKAFLKP